MSHTLATYLTLTVFVTLLVIIIILMSRGND